MTKSPFFIVKKVVLGCWFVSFMFLAVSCQKKQQKNTKSKKSSSEYIIRKSNTSLYPLKLPEHRARELYPWEKPCFLSHITKEFFRCKGSHINPPVVDSSNPEKIVTFKDCDGRHGFSTKRAVFPVLVDLLNYLQRKTQKKVVITSGYRCLKHNQYTDRSLYSKNSKHLIGAEVDFYIEGYEEKPEAVVQFILDFYKSEKRYHKNKDYQTFFRYEKTTNVSIKPWYNKEIFIKLFKSEEGRNFDNRHPYSYVSVQVRFDRETGKRITMSY